jgi:putative hydrolase of the HAD superfamily
MMQHRQQVLQETPELAGDVTLLRQNMLRRTLAEHGYSSDVAEAAFDVFYQARSQVQLYSGCNELLTGLRRRYKVAAITNGNADLAIAGIDHYFDAIHKADLVKLAKPHRHMFDLCLDGFELEPSAMLHVGDNPQTDVGGAQALGIKTVWFNSQQISWPEAQPRADFEVKSLTELHELLLVE